MVFMANAYGERPSMIRNSTIIGALFITVCVAALWSISVGAIEVPFEVVLNTLFDWEGPKQTYIINKSRLPRTLIGLVTGASLALAGAIIQTLLHNALASPKIIGINSGAALAVLLSAMALPAFALSWPPAIAIAGGCVAAAIIYCLAEFHTISINRLVLVGIAIGFIFDAGVDFILVSANTYDISAPLVWLTGSLWGRGWGHLNSIWPLLLPLCVIGCLLFHRLNLMMLGKSLATGLGVNLRLERFVLLLVASMLAAISVSAVGVLGFVGLMAPHIARNVVGGRHGAVLPVAMFVGALLVVVADGAGRSIAPPIEISAGILTALFGAPFFVLLLVNQSRGARL